ncbi:hypothetical protein IMCC21224_113689 [Puniceibacterium sp. IMCC21224]|nr:DUF1643 domain-containing protein [Puniceibacterium sp. IMCC21224]KMK68803.1 hypothetical protein IMCC21224_113689 [Puniceibacterium sp. IMCC21224]
MYSPCERYRYSLSRIWDPAAETVAFVMLNPSTATELRNDPTIERCERRARQMGYGGVSIANLFAFRATKPADLKAAPDPIGPENDAVLWNLASRAACVIAAWGTHGALLERGPALAQQLGRLWHLGLTKDGHPRHPLYVSYQTRLQLWPEAERYAG